MQAQIRFVREISNDDMNIMNIQMKISRRIYRWPDTITLKRYKVYTLSDLEGLVLCCI